jgi:hypothetical protein
MVVMMVVMVVSRSHHLRLRSDRSRGAEDNDEPEQKPFHIGIDAHSAGRITKPGTAPISLHTPWFCFCYWFGFVS